MKTHATTLLCCWAIILGVSGPAMTGAKDGDKAVSPEVAGLIAKLDPKKEADCLAALGQLADLGPKAAPASKALVGLFSTTHEETRILAALALGKIGEAATDEVVKRLDDADPEVRFYAVWTLGLIGPAAAKELDKVLPLLADKNPGVRRKTLYTLGQLKTGGAKVIQSLAAALSDDNNDVRTEARDALVAIGPAAAEAGHRLLVHEAEPTRRMACEVLVRLADKHETAIPFLVDAMFARDETVRYTAAAGLAKLHVFDVPTVLALARGLRDENSQTRYWCAQALAKAGPAAGPAVPVLLETIYDRNYSISRPAWNALNNCGHDPQPMVKKRLRDDDPQMRLESARVLHDLAGNTADTVETLQEMVERGRLADRVEAAYFFSRTHVAWPKLGEALEWMIHLEDQASRDRAMDAVGNLMRHDPSAIRLMTHFLADRRAEVRIRAAVALHQLREKGTPAQRALLASMTDPDDTVRYYVLIALESQSADFDTCYPAVKKMLQDERYGSSFSHYLTFSGTSKAWQHKLFFQGIDDKEKRARQLAIRVVQYRDRGDRDREIVERLGKTAREDDDGETRGLALQALVQRLSATEIGELVACVASKHADTGDQAANRLRSWSADPARVIKDILPLLKDDAAPIRRRAAWILGGHGSAAEPALPALRAAIKDASKEVRDAAAQATASIEAAIAARKSEKK